MRHTLPLLAGLATLPSGVLSWTTDMTLSWPEPHYENTTDYDPLASIDSFDPKFPCRSVPPPSNVTRVPWPIAGARIRLQRTSNLWNRTKDVDTSKVGTWYAQYSFGQFEGLDVGDIENPVFQLDEEEWVPKDFEIGGWCTKRTEVVDWVVKDGAVKNAPPPAGISVKKSDLEGVNATLGFYLRQTLGNNVTTHTQCVYVQFSSDASAGPCKKASTLPSEKEDDDNGVIFTFPDGPPNMGNEERPFFINVAGLAVGLVVGIAFLLCCCCCCYRSKKRKSSAVPRQNPSRVEDIELQFPKPPTNPDDEQLPAYTGPPPRYNTGIGPAAAGAAAPPAAPPAAPTAAATITATGGAGN